MTTSVAGTVQRVLGARAWAAVHEAGRRPIVACSGGPDSVALLALAAAAGVEPMAIHVDHGLRPGSGDDFAVVAQVARRFGVHAESVAVTVGSGASLEAHARSARYDALEAAAARHRAPAILVGHTRDDQAETVLLNILRGSGVTGLGGMPARRGLIARPLLTVARAGTLELCAQLRLPVVTDPMNSDVHHRRVWLRREVLPRLEAGAGRDLRAVLARQADGARAESDVLDQLGAALLRDAGDPPRADVFNAAEVAVARRAVRRWLRQGAPPALDDVDAVLAVAAGMASVANLAGGASVVRRRGALVMRSAARHPAHLPVDFALPGSIAAHGLQLDAWIERAAPVRWPDGHGACVLDADVAGDRAVVRAAEPGERFQPLGLRGTKPLRDVFAEMGVAAWQRDACPVIAAPSGDALWVVGYRIADHARVTARTRRYLWITAAKGPPSPLEMGGT